MKILTLKIISKVTSIAVLQETSNQLHYFTIITIIQRVSHMAIDNSGATLASVWAKILSEGSDI